MSTDFTKQVGQTPEVKCNWWEGGTTAQRRSWFVVRVVQFAAVHESAVKREHHATTSQTAPALRIRLVGGDDEEDGGGDDAWMDMDQY
jgi:hypothetical protein